MIAPAVGVGCDTEPRTVAADRFVDAAGVNIHLHYDNTLYRNNFPLVQTRLIELGVRHVRDGLVDTAWQPYYQRHNALGQAGIKGTYITAPGQSEELWASYPGRVSSSFEAYEAPNEYNMSGDPNWVATLTDTVTRLGTIRNDPRASAFPVYGPSMAEADEGIYAALGDLSEHFDAANLHNYFAGRHPCTPGWGTNGYGSIAWNVNVISPYAGGKPIVTTETGYQDGAVVDAIPPDVAGRYAPRVLLEQFRSGIIRTYLYELADFPRSGNYGLLNRDGSPKPAFTAIKGLLNLLADPGPDLTPMELDYAVEAVYGGVRHMAFQKRDGTYLLALWLALPAYDIASRSAITVWPQPTTVTLPPRIRHVQTHRWQFDGSVTAEPGAPDVTDTIALSVTDTLTIVELVREPLFGGLLNFVKAPPLRDASH